MEEEKLNHEKTSDGTQASDDHESPIVTSQAEGSKEEQQDSTTDDADQNPAANETNADEGQWVTGIKLAVINIALTMAAFLMLLDTSIVATVSVTSCVPSRMVVNGSVGSSTDHE
jgi:hypothetical protein